MILCLHYLAGILSGELFQWSTWKAGHPDEPWKDYWKVGLPHLIVNLTVVLAVYFSWACGLLTWLLGMFGASPIAQLLSVSGPWAFLVAFISDICGDKIAYVLRSPAGKLLKKVGLKKRECE